MLPIFKDVQVVEHVFSYYRHKDLAYTGWAITGLYSPTFVLLPFFIKVGVTCAISHSLWSFPESKDFLNTKYNGIAKSSLHSFNIEDVFDLVLDTCLVLAL